jgi:peptide/nickel transport system permease protein
MTEAQRNHPLYLAWRRFRRSRAGLVSAGVLGLLYLVALLAGFLSPNGLTTQNPQAVYQPPHRIHIVRDGQLVRPFVYQLKKERDPVTFITAYREDAERPTPVRFLIRQSEPYRLLFWQSNLRIWGVPQTEGTFYPLGTDQFGRCLLSRILVGSQVSLTVGVIGVLISFALGILLGGISGFFSGQRFRLLPGLASQGPWALRITWSLIALGLLAIWTYGILLAWPFLSRSAVGAAMTILLGGGGLLWLLLLVWRGLEVDVDSLIQRTTEVLLSIPRLPILMALATVIPASWPSSYVYLGIIAVLSFIGWAGLARVVRGQVLAIREVDYVTAAGALGASRFRIIGRHILPNLTSYLIVSATLALPGYIIGESALSFLGLGIKEPMASWGLLLKDAQNFQGLYLYPWLLTPGILIFVSVLAYNFLGDALRDAADVRSVD